jgi:hypothetical protein
MKKKQPKHPEKNRLLTALRTDLSTIERSPYVRSLSEGKEYICTVCEMPVKPCDADPSAVCGHMVREGTDSWYIEESLQQPDVHIVGLCSSCGKRISPAQLKKNPLAELCAACVKSGVRVLSAHAVHA